MISVLAPLDEPRRLEALRAFEVLDTPPEAAFDDLAVLAAQICGTAAAFVSFVDDNREWFKARIGFAMTEVEARDSLSILATQQAELFTISDAAADERLSHSRLVANAPDIRFFAAAPLLSKDGAAVGAIGVFDAAPRELKEEERHSLLALARQCMAQLELRLLSRKWKSSLEERRQTETALRAGKEKLAAILNAEPECVKLLEPDGVLHEINPAGLDLIEAETLDLVIGRSVLPLIVPEDRESIRMMLEAASLGGKHTREFQMTGLKGKRRWMEMIAVPLRDESLGKNMVLGVSHDITAHKIAEDKLRESERCFRQVVENISEVFWMYDVETKNVLYISPRYEEIWGRTCESLFASPMSWSEAVHPDDRERVLQTWRTNFGVAEYREEYRISRPDGASRWIRDRGFPVRDSNGRIYRVAGVAEDITEQKRLEEEFQQSRKMEAIGQLASGVAHDFNNLLTVIQGNASLLLGEIQEEAHDSVEEIIQASERASSLTRQLLLFSRKQAMQAVDLDLNDIVGNTTRMLQRILGEDIALRANFAPGLPLIRADASMIEQILLNLAVNSRDAMPAGGRLVISTSAETPDERAENQASGLTTRLCACLRVSDTGCGIPPEILPRIYEPFFSTKEVGKGTGLGLATVYAIVRQHHGWIDVESKQGEGTTFRIFFPASLGNRSESKSDSTPQKLPGGDETILVVEDDPSLRALSLHLLRRCGYAVHIASSGRDALQVWLKNRESIDLLLTDMVMPDGIGGRELAEQLQSEKPRLKVVFTSGYSSEAVGKGAMLTEGVNFLQKPYHAHGLAKIVRDCLDRR